MKFTSSLKSLFIPALTSLMTVATVSAQMVGPTTPPNDSASAPAASDASSPPPADSGWDFTVSVPIWLVGVTGDINVRGADVDVDGDEPDIDFLESELNGAFALHGEAQKNRFGVLFDAMYLERTAEGTLDATDAEGSLEAFVGELAAIYSFVQPAPDKRGWGAFRFDGLGGLRISALEIGVDSDAFTGDASRTFYDPFLGARLELGLTRWLSVKLRGDVGGFGIEAWHASDLTYNIDTGLEFHLAECFDLGLGYRWLGYDLDVGSDSNLDVRLSGPVVEVKFNF